MHIRIHGHTGTVGRQLFHWLMAGKRDHEISGISLGDTYGWHEADANLVFICVPTPNTEDGKQDQAILSRTIDAYRGQEVAIVIRSTVMPGTTDWFAAEYPEIVFFHWPEFLSARTAREDFRSPEIQIVGIPDAGADLYRLDWLTNIAPLLPYGLHETTFMSYSTAEAFKYAHNLHGAMQVIFANQMYDICNAVEADWEKIRHKLPWLGYVSWKQAGSYWDVWKDEERGYAGACFPKDVEALRTWCPYNGVPTDLIDGIEHANKLLRNPK